MNKKNLEIADHKGPKEVKKNTTDTLFLLLAAIRDNDYEQIKKQICNSELVLEQLQYMMFFSPSEMNRIKKNKVEKELKSYEYIQK